MIKIKANHIIIYKAFQECSVFQTTHVLLISSNVSAHSVVVQCKILLSVLSSCFFENCSFVLCMLSASLMHFRILADVLIFIMKLFNTNSNVKIVSHYHVIMNLNRMIVGNIWTLISSNHCVGGINLNQCYLRIFHSIAIMQLHNGLKRLSSSSKLLPEFFF